MKSEAEGLESLKQELLSLMHQERVRISKRYSEAFAAKDIPREEVRQYHSPMTDTLTNVIAIIDIRLHDAVHASGAAPQPLLAEVAQRLLDEVDHHRKHDWRE